MDQQVKTPNSIFGAALGPGIKTLPFLVPSLNLAVVQRMGSTLRIAEPRGGMLQTLAAKISTPLRRHHREIIKLLWCRGTRTLPSDFWDATGLMGGSETHTIGEIRQSLNLALRALRGDRRALAEIEVLAGEGDTFAEIILEACGGAEAEALARLLAPLADLLASLDVEQIPAASAHGAADSDPPQLLQINRVILRHGPTGASRDLLAA